MTKTKITQEQKDMSIAIEIICEILEPFIYDEKVNIKKLFQCIEKHYLTEFNTPFLLLGMAHEESGISDFQDIIRKKLCEDLTEGD